MTSTYDAIVIGAGHNGLVAAAYMARAGLEVLVVERRELVGGTAVTEQIFPGFDFDAGAHRIGSLHPALVGDLALARHGVEIVQADPTVFSPSLDGRHLLLWRDPRQSVEEIRRLSKADAEAWVPFGRLIAKAAGLLQAAGSVTPPDVTGRDVGDLWSMLKLGARLRGLGKKDMVEVLRLIPMSVSELLDDWFETDVLKGTLAASGIAGMFQGPMAAGTAHSLLSHHVGHEAGVLRPTTRVRGGVGVLTEALASAAKEHGVQVRTGQAVERVIVKEGRAVGVALESGEEIGARRVISNADPRRTFMSLVDPVHLPPEFVRKVQNIRFKGTSAKVHLVLGELPKFNGTAADGPHLNGVVSISPSVEYLERAYDDAKYGEPSRRPYLEVSIPSVTDSGSATGSGSATDSGTNGSGGYAVSILAQYAPYHLKEGTWDSARRDALGDSVVRTLAEYAPNVESAVLQRHVMTPLDLEETYGLTEGNVYHGEITLDQMFFMRPVPGFARYRSPVEGLYMCGAGTHPGGGVTGVPGYNAACEIVKDAKAGRGN